MTKHHYFTVTLLFILAIIAVLFIDGRVTFGDIRDKVVEVTQTTRNGGYDTNGHLDQKNLTRYHLAKINPSRPAAGKVDWRSPEAVTDGKWHIQMNSGKDLAFSSIQSANAFLSAWGLAILPGPPTSTDTVSDPVSAPAVILPPSSEPEETLPPRSQENNNPPVVWWAGMRTT